MTRDEIIAMVKEAGIAPHLGCTDDEGNHRPAVNALKTSVPIEWLERFAALVAAAEREACAQVCESWDDPRDYAAAIRARGAA